MNNVVAFDKITLEKNFSGDRDILIKIVLKFLENQSDYLENLISSFKEKNSDQFRIACHSIKGICRNFCYDEGNNIADKYEHLAANGELPNEVDFNQFISRIKTLINDLSNTYNQ